MTTLLNRALRAGWLSAALPLTMCLATGCVGSGEPEPEAASAQSALTESGPANVNPALYPKDARPFALSMTEWAENWWRWAYSIPLATNPTSDPSQSCDQNQDAPVFFLTSSDTGKNIVPRDKPIGVALASLMADYPCPDPTYKPAAGQSLYDFLLPQAKAPQDEVASIDATLDGKPLKDLLGYRVTSKELFYFVGNKSLAAPTFDTCVTGKPQPAVADAVFIMIKPLPPGPHVLTENLVLDSGEAVPTTVSFTVR